eukprot:scaffold1356_cov123-Cylindrotheca_fusiformis.AAC.37
MTDDCQVSSSIDLNIRCPIATGAGAAAGRSDRFIEHRSCPSSCGTTLHQLEALGEGNEDT